MANSPHTFPARRGIRSRLIFGLMSVALLALTACTPETLGGPQSIFRPESDYARTLSDLTIYIVAWAAFVAVLVFSFIAVVLVRYRHRKGQPLPNQIHGNTRLEIAWTIAPAVILAAIAVPTIGVIFQTQAPPAPGALEVRVTGHQWWWDFEYPEYGLRTSNEVHIPTGRQVVFYLNSADVLHSFWIPRLAGKRDVVPNQNNFFWLTATTPGVYGGQCAEFCGASHALMLFKAVAHEPAQFDAWVQQQLAPAAAPAPGTPAAAGLVAYNGAGCIACHAIRGTNSAGVVGPDLSHFGTRLTVAAGILDNNKENLVRWLRNPQAVKPGALMPNLNLSQQDAAAIADYLLSLQ